jgi:hypothetical protein
LHDGDGPARIDQLFRRAGLANDAPSIGTLVGISPRRGEPSSLSIIGLLLVIGGLIAVAYFMLVFDTSVPVGEYGIDRVNNIGLLRDQQNGIIGGIVAAVVGGVLMFIAHSRGDFPVSAKTAPASDDRKCPHCAETIKADAVICRFCNRDVSQGTAG